MKLSGERREVTALFTDVEGFTTMTQRADPERLVAVLDSYFDEHDTIGTGGAARSSALVEIDESSASEGVWRVEQTIDDPAGDHDWGISAEIDLAESDEQGFAVVTVTGVDRL